MNKKFIISVVIGVIVILCAGAAALYFSSRPKDDSTNNQSNDSSNNSQEEAKVNGDKILVAYYSAQNHTKAVAEKIAQNLGADIFEIIPEDIYTAEDLDWMVDSSRVSREHEDESLRDVALETITPANWDEYDTILIGYPIWWGIAAWPVNNFVKDNDFSGKTVIPFCTSTSSGLGQSGELLKQMANDGNWQAGHRFSYNATGTEIKAWTDSL